MKKSIQLFLIMFCSVSSSHAAITLKAGDQSHLELFALVFGGLGIFLIGIRLTGFNLKRITGGSFKHAVLKIVESKVGVLLWGIFLGLFTQSGKATAFILADFVQAGVVKSRRCAPVVFWGNAGSSLIVFASMLSIKILALLMFGATAFGITFNIPKRLVFVYGGIFGLAMIMYGLYLVKLGAAGFAGFEWVQVWLDYLSRFSMLSFTVGFILTLLVQSNLAIIMIMIALASAGVLTLEEVAMGIYGAQAGTGLLTYFFSFHTKGRARQVVAYQISFDVLASSVFVVLFYVETLTGLPLLIALCRTVSSNLGVQAVVLALLFQFGSVCVCLSVKNITLELIEKKFPPSTVEVLSDTEYIHTKIADSPETGLLLVEKEQFRLLQRLPLYIDYVRDPSIQDKTTPQIYHEAFVEVSTSIENALSEISGNSLSEVDSDHLISVAKLQEQLVNLESIVFKLTRTLERQNLDSKAGMLGKNIMESVDFIVMAAIDAIESKNESEIDALAKFTYDRTDMMAKIRHDYFNSEQELSKQERTFVLDITMLFESVIQTLSRYGVLLSRS